MNDKKSNEIDIQRNFYKKIANQYNKGNVENKFSAAFEHGEHYFALSCLAGLTDYLKIKSILDNIIRARGLVFVYSEFRNIEGIEL